VWLGSLLAFGGTLLITLDRTGGGNGSSGGSPQALLDAGAPTAGAAVGDSAGLLAGDALTLAAALCYSAATVRIPVWAVRRGVSPLQLSLGKAAFLTAVSVAALGLQSGQPAAAGQSVADHLAALWPGWQQPEGWAILLWVALGPGALGSVLHVRGQSLVSPTAAQIAFCSVPLWSAALAAATLPGETISAGTWAGGGTIAAAGLVAALGPGGREDTQQKQQQGSEDGG
jgi:drug/metabolite transporter (DMT)-like permease